MTARCENCGRSDLSHPENALCDRCWDAESEDPFGGEDDLSASRVSPVVSGAREPWEFFDGD